MIAPAHCWPLARAADMLLAIGEAAGCEPVRRPAPALSLERTADAVDTLSDYLGTCAERFELEAERVRVRLSDLPREVGFTAPAALLCVIGGSSKLLAVLRSRGERVQLLTPDGARVWARRRSVAELAGEPFRRRISTSVDPLLAALPPERRERARRGLLAQQASDIAFSQIWVVRPAPHRRWSTLLRETGAYRSLAGSVAAHLAHTATLVAAWYLVGKGALSGTLEVEWLWGWALLLVLMAPLRMLTRWHQGRFAIHLGLTVHRRLIHGVLRLDSSWLSSQGVGQLLGRAIEAEGITSLGLTAVLVGVTASIEVVVSLAVVLAGAGGLVHLALLLAVGVSTTLLAWRHTTNTRAWTRRRIDLTNNLVENMAGHETRQVQCEPGTWHDADDGLLDRYCRSATSMDWSSAVLAVVPRIWLAASVILLAVQMVSSSTSSVRMAIALGGTLMAYQALQSVVAAVSASATALTSFEHVRPIFKAAAATEIGTLGQESRASVDAGTEVLTVRDLVYRYPDRDRRVLDNCSLSVHSGQRILLEGGSGSGKSTLLSLIGGQLSPDSGLLLLRGLDPATWGDRGWVKQIAHTPQFHQNHVFTGTLAFNLLMGRRWPAEPADLDEAEALCRRLGLSAMLDRMPSGLQQLVGESGWRLSHGERNRIFLARALLQGANLVMLDETLAALDPETLAEVGETVLEEAETLIVVVHR